MISQSPAVLAQAPAARQIILMPPEPPPETDAEFRVVHGPWPRWALHLSLIKLMLWGMAMSALAILAALIVLKALGAFD